MKLLAPSALVLCAALATQAAPAALQEREEREQQESLEERVSALADQLADVRLDLDRLRQELRSAPKDAPAAVSSDELNAVKRDAADCRSALDQVVRYLHAQAGGAIELKTVLDDSEEKGFIAGINSESRKVLFAGLRQFADGLQRDLPALRSEMKKPSPAVGSRR